MRDVDPHPHVEVLDALEQVVAATPEGVTGRAPAQCRSRAESSPSFLMGADASNRVGGGSSLPLAGCLGVNQASRKSVFTDTALMFALYCRYVLSRDDPSRRRFARGRAQRASAWCSRSRGCAARRGEPRPPRSRRHVGRTWLHVEPAQSPTASRNVEGIDGARRRSRVLIGTRTCVICGALSSPGSAKAAQACLHRATISG